MCVGALFSLDPGNSQEKSTEARRSFHRTLLGALIQYLINSLSRSLESRDLSYSRGRAASILRAVAKGSADTWRRS